MWDRRLAVTLRLIGKRLNSISLLSSTRFGAYCEETDENDLSNPLMMCAIVVEVE